MQLIDRIAAYQDEIKSWRRQIHARPELGFEEVETADFVAGKLEEWGVPIYRGLAKTGIVGSIEGRSNGGRAIGLRADMDALPMDELNDFAHRSQNSGRMHACGHDGHTAMLLAAARYLAETRNFDGTIHLIFQPAEELAGGGRVMVEEGLFQRFPVEAVYGMHNAPDVPLGKFALRTGPAMAAADTFEITVTGSGAHAAMPHLGIDSLVLASQIVIALQTIASRRSDPLDPVVVSTTQIHGGDAWNVLPETAVIRGCARTLSAENRDMVEREIARIAHGVADSQGASVAVTYERGYPVLINHAAESRLAAEVAETVVGEGQVEPDALPIMASEDFAYMLEARPGCYIWLGNGGGGPGGCTLHNPYYDFNDEASVIGASYWVRLVETTLPLGQ